MTRLDPNAMLKWTREELAQKGVPSDVQKTIEHWMLDNHNLNYEGAVELFADLVARMPAPEELPAEEGVWIPVKPGNLVVREAVRSVHDGRVGKVVAIRYGVITVMFEGQTVDESMATKFKPSDLEKRVR